ncbi:hypothetical protein NDU88_003829 [Pleurodeles waltl]|uniref:Uncharacterized protein n=1 Tax=Pleurodeles waltl TaxID=8319 RepID=A0AAV7PAQ2_PLEWA|nr:hypothetical protein NDU88_003829 [Pleurodeles waltl]
MGALHVQRSGEAAGGPTLPGAPAGVLVGLRHLQQCERPGRGLSGGGGPHSGLLSSRRLSAARASPCQGHHPPCLGRRRVAGRETAEVHRAPCLGPVRRTAAPSLVRAGKAEAESVPPGLAKAEGGLSLRECFPPELGPRSRASLRHAEGECPARRPRWQSGAGAPVPPKVRSESGGEATGATTGGAPRAVPEGEVGEAPRRSRGESGDWPRNQSEAAERRERRPGLRDGPSPGGPLSLAPGDQRAWRAQSGLWERLDRGEGLGPETLERSGGFPAADGGSPGGGIVRQTGKKERKLEIGARAGVGRSGPGAVALLQPFSTAAAAGRARIEQLGCSGDANWGHAPTKVSKVVDGSQGGLRNRCVVSPLTTHWVTVDGAAATAISGRNCGQLGWTADLHCLVETHPILLVEITWGGIDRLRQRRGPQWSSILQLCRSRSDKLIWEALGARVALEGKVSTVAVEVNLLRADLRKVSDKVKVAERSIVDLQTEVYTLRKQMAQVNTTVGTLEARLEDSEGISRRNNVRLLGFPERAEGSAVESFVEKWIRDILQLEGLSRLSRVFVV